MLNHLVAEALREAHDRGIVQVQGRMYVFESNKEACALGAIHSKLHDWNLLEAIYCINIPLEMLQKFHMNSSDRTAIVNANDTHDKTFIEIAEDLEKEAL